MRLLPCVCPNRSLVVSPKLQIHPSIRSPLPKPNLLSPEPSSFNPKPYSKPKFPTPSGIQEALVPTFFVLERGVRGSAGTSKVRLLRVGHLQRLGPQLKPFDVSGLEGLQGSPNPTSPKLCTPNSKPCT